MGRAPVFLAQALLRTWHRARSRFAGPTTGGRNPWAGRRSCPPRPSILGLEMLEPRQMLAAHVVISEVLASNDNDLRDEDRNRPDWIEVLNADTDAVDLDGWFLTDDAQDLQKWRLPEVPLEPGARTVVFASGKDRAEAGAQLHTNFKLRAAGEYLALVEPDGATVAFEYAPQYPPQVPDVSFGMPQAFDVVALHALGDTASYLIPTDDGLDLSWTEADFDDGAWSDGATGVGYSLRTEFDEVIGTDVKATMKDVSPSLYLRVPFHVEDLGTFFSLTLGIRYNDGYVAFLNGVEVARSNAPDELELTWDSLAPTKRGKTKPLVPDEVDLTPFLHFLEAGDNVLAIHGLNAHVSNAWFLIGPELTALTAGELQVDDRQYFAYPTAGGANGLGTTTTLVDVSHSPMVLGHNENLTVTATVISTAGTVAPLMLRYRVMFDGEISMPMFDDGLHADGDPGDGIYGATIPATAAAVPGQMIRYRITAGETPENFARSPVFADPLERQEYWGTMVVDSSINSNLPVIHLFLEDPDAADTADGTHGALYYDGELYDNIRIDDHGFSTLVYPKQSHDVFFPRDHRFRVADGAPRMKDINLLTNFGDPTLLRNTLSYAMRGAAGNLVHLAYPVRVQQNGEFHGIYDFVEDGDDEYLERVGLDPNGALYKMDNPLEMGEWSVEKKTRTWEDKSDLQALIDGLKLEEDERTAFLFDNINLPAMANFIAGLVLVGEVDCCWRNYYAYRDTEGNGEWQYLPWDVDKSLGHMDTRDPNQLEFHFHRGGDPFGYGNRLFTPLFANPDFVEMYLRRLRTVMDELVQPPGTPAEERVLNRWIDDLAEQLAPEISLEFAAWDRIEPESTWTEQIELFKEYYFPHRRVFLYGLKGDMNLDGQRDLTDIDDFVLGVSSPASYAAKYGTSVLLRGDLDLDGDLDFDDVGRFVSLMNGNLPSPLNRVDMIPDAQVGTPEIEFGVVDSSPASGNQDEEFIELVNRNDVAVDISGWQLTGGIKYTFRPGVVIPSGKSLYVSPDVVTFRARATGPSGGQGLFVQGDYSGNISSLGETIRLVAGDGTGVASVTTPSEPSPAQAHLRISEITYHPPAVAAGSPFADEDFECFEPLEARQMLAANVVISELLASNDNDLEDEDRNRPDWIEVLNADTDAVDLDGWFLTDDARDLRKWSFPEVPLEPGARIVVFASGKNRAQPGAELHTNFKLNAAGEYLALVQPDGTTVAFEYAPQYPPQVPDVSFGMPQEIAALSLHALGDTARYLIPADDGLDLNWTEADFDDGVWTDGATGVGYSFRTEFDDVIHTNVKDELHDVNPSVYLRVPFHVDDLGSLFLLTLSIRYNDGYVAFLNGVEVARSNAPDDLTWNALAPAARDKTLSLIPEEVDLAPFLNLLNAGNNVLAIQGLNTHVRNARFLIAPELTALVTSGELQIDKRNYFAYPSAGGGNGFGTTTALVDVAHSPMVPGHNENLSVTATVISMAGTVSPVILHYRVMFDGETSVPMFDDGLHSDGDPDDGIYGATIPTADVAVPGQMIRYRITAGETPVAFARCPVFADLDNTEEYFGTVMEDPSTRSNLPVIHLFVEDPEASETPKGTRGSLFHDGAFYDNIEIDVTGNTIGRKGPKKSHDIFFTSDHWFELQVGDTQLRMNDFDIIQDYYNRAKMRIPLAHQAWRNMGTPTHLSFPVRIERNGEFHGTYAFINGGNEQFLEEAGLSPEGALYKMRYTFSSQGGFKKVTRKYEDYSDFEALFAGFDLPTQPERTSFLLDNVNIPAMVNLLAGLVLTSHGDCCYRNLYAYRDTEGTGEWEVLPYDFDGSLGRGGHTSDTLHLKSVGVDPSSRGNDLFAALYADVPGFRSMYLRRLRTVLDEFLQPPGTPAEDLWFEQRIDEMAEQMAADALLDSEKWGTWGADPTWREQVDALRNEYFPRRRIILHGLVGDMDLSGTVDTGDIDDFVQGLADPAAYEQAYGIRPSLRGDTDYDTDLDFDDIGRFVALVNGAPQWAGALPAAQVGAPEIEFGAIDFNPASGNQDEEFIELTNRNDVAVDISGWELTGGVDYTFAPGVVISAGGSLYVSPNVNAFRARQTGPSGGQGLFVDGDYSGRISSVSETIELVATDGTVVATVTTPSEPLPAQVYLRISEIMYHPRDPGSGSLFDDDDDFEFIELVNTSDEETIDLENVAFTRGVEFTFAATTLAPGERTLVVRDVAAFVERYGAGPAIAGQYGGTPADFKLSNRGEALRLEDADGVVIQQFTYDDWYESTDGDGHSLEIVDPGGLDLALWGQRQGWLPSSDIDGTPGADRASAASAVGTSDHAIEPISRPAPDAVRGGTVIARRRARSPQSGPGQNDLACRKGSWWALVDSAVETESTWLI